MIMESLKSAMEPVVMKTLEPIIEALSANGINVKRITPVFTSNIPAPEIRYNEGSGSFEARLDVDSPDLSRIPELPGLKEYEFDFCKGIGRYGLVLGRDPNTRIAVMINYNLSDAHESERQGIEQMRG